MVEDAYHPGRLEKEDGTEREHSKVGRFWEVDAARGVAILMMVLYHLTYDLDTLGRFPIESTSGFWALFADATATLFLFLVGVSLVISHSRTGGRSSFGKFFWRGLRVFGYGMILTVVFWVFGMETVVFGILHLIGVSIILAYPFLRHRFVSLVAGGLIFAVGVWMMSLDLTTQSPLLLPFGFVPEGLFMPDYRPLLPWFGVVLIGVFFGSLVYGNGKSPAGRRPFWGRPLGFLGRWSLGIYLVHQPVMIGLLALLSVIDVGL